MLSKKLENFLQDKQRTRQVLHLFFSLAFWPWGKDSLQILHFFQLVQQKKNSSFKHFKISPYQRIQMRFFFLKKN
jgi:hypothetical protein